MCKVVKNTLKILAILGVIIGAFAVVYHFLQKKEAMVDETIDSLDDFEDDYCEEEQELPKQKKHFYKRSYISIPFHEA